MLTHETKQQQQMQVRDSMKSGELDNMSEKSDKKDESTIIIKDSRNVSTRSIGDDNAPAAAPSMSPPKRDQQRDQSSSKLPGDNYISPIKSEPWMAGIEDINLDNMDEILECGDDLMDIEQTAFMGSSKIMLKMIDNMLLSIDQRIDMVQPNDHMQQQ